MSPVICTLQAPTLRAGLMTVASHMYTGTQAHKYTGTQYTVPRYTGGGKYFHSSLHPGHSLSSAKTNHKMSVFYSFFLTSRFWPRLDAPLAGAGVVAASTQSCKNRSTSMSMSMSMSNHLDLLWLLPLIWNPWFWTFSVAGQANSGVEGVQIEVEARGIEVA